ncbi:MAG: hypothetical protein ABIQ04_03925 [Candidatus Saccharimonadales bacterium]
MQSTIKEVGDDAFISRKYKVLREGWIAAMYAKAASKAMSNLIYLRPNPIDSQPDYFGFRVVNGDGITTGENFEIEVFEWGLNSTDELYEALKKKVMKYTSPQTIFVCYAYKPLRSLDFSSLAEKIKDLSPNISELSLVMQYGNETGHRLIKLYPEPGYLYIPNSFSKLFYPKYDFAQKIRALKNVDAGLVKIDSEMRITEVQEFGTRLL